MIASQVTEISTPGTNNGQYCCCELHVVTEATESAEDYEVEYDVIETSACEHAVVMMNVETGISKFPQGCRSDAMCRF